MLKNENVGAQFDGSIDFWNLFNKRNGVRVTAPIDVGTSDHTRKCDGPHGVALG